MSSQQPKNVRSTIMSGLLGPGLSGNKSAVPPVLKTVGQLAAGVASVNTSGSATGNPRNKCALQPGHSLMDWIRLGNSGKDLTGVGPMAGRMTVTVNELKKHDKETDAWLAIRGKVFNVTAYLPFHPGGVEELLKGAGKDATTLFDQVHQWVNYEQILQKCFIGRLVTSTPSNATIEEVFSIEPKSKPVNKSKDLPIETKETKTDSPKSVNDSISLPRFDWIQKLDEISFVFYTGALSNPSIHISYINGNINITLVYDGKGFLNEIVPCKEFLWPGQTRVNFESGKVELTFRKSSSGIWENFGILKQSIKSAELSFKYKYNVIDKIQVACNIFLLKLKRDDGTSIVTPIGSHLRVFAEIKDEEKSRSYTPIPDSSSFVNWSNQLENSPEIYLMVKRYPDGFVSKYVSDAIKGDILQTSNSLTGPLVLSHLEKKVLFLMLAAGTGVTPMLGLLKFLLERRIRKSQCVRLLFCNRQLKHVPFIKQFKDLQEYDSRFKIEHILSEPEENWKGYTGHIDKNVIEATVEEIVTTTNRPLRDLFVFVCGPAKFNDLCVRLLQDLNIEREQTAIFQG